MDCRGEARPMAFLYHCPFSLIFWPNAGTLLRELSGLKIPFRGFPELFNLQSYRRQNISAQAVVNRFCAATGRMKRHRNRNMRAKNRDHVLNAIQCNIVRIGDRISSNPRPYRSLARQAWHGCADAGDFQLTVLRPAVLRSSPECGPRRCFLGLQGTSKPDLRGIRWTTVGHSHPAYI